MESFAKTIIVLGISLTIIGLMFLLGGKLGFSRLPGDICFKRGNTTFYFPIATSLLLSLVLSLIFNLLMKK